MSFFAKVFSTRTRKTSPNRRSTVPSVELLDGRIMMSATPVISHSSLPLNHSFAVGHTAGGSATSHAGPHVDNAQLDVLRNGSHSW
jgi:hypothetical protein